MNDKQRWKLLADYAEVLNRHGPDSDEARAFEDRYADDDELTSLMMTSLAVKRMYAAKA